jgi:hypothetical protein
MHYSGIACFADCEDQPKMKTHIDKGCGEVAYASKMLPVISGQTNPLMAKYVRQTMYKPEVGH